MGNIPNVISNWAPPYTLFIILNPGFKFKLNWRFNENQMHYNELLDRHASSPSSSHGDLTQFVVLYSGSKNLIVVIRVCQEFPYMHWVKIPRGNRENIVINHQ